MNINKFLSSLTLSMLLAIIPAIPLAAGKIENATMDQVVYAMNTTIQLAEDTLKALDDGADHETILDMLKQTKQIHKEIEIIRLGAIKGRAAGEMKKARSAAKKNDLVATREHLVKGIEHYHALRKKFYDY